MRRLAKEYPVEVVHRCFALAPIPEAIVEIFGSKEKGKREILDHWRMANLNDDEHRINADLMKKEILITPLNSRAISVQGSRNSWRSECPLGCL